MTTHACDTLRCMTNPEVHAAVNALADAAATAQSDLAHTTGETRNDLLEALADALDAQADHIAEANAADMAQARADGMDEGKLDRLYFGAKRVRQSAQGVRHVSTLPDPLGEIVRGSTLPNGLRLQQIRVPIGVIGMIYEARPNVTVDVASLCLKSGNAAILRGGHAAERTNAATLEVIRGTLAEHGLDPALVASVDAYGRDGATAMMQARGHIDVLVPRGGAGLIQSVVRNSTVPVIETGVGNCHVYVDKDADLDMAANIIYNAKCSRPSVCNAIETILVHQNVAEEALPLIQARLDEKQVELRGCEKAQAILPGIPPATEEDWATEYLDYILAVKVVASLEEALEHIARYSTGHSECIVTENYTAAQRFLNEVDAAAVYVNASTRFTDGGQFGLGAEIGISTPGAPWGWNSW